MSNIDIIRAWKDEAYRATLTPEQLASLPANPAGQIELTEVDLENIAGGKPKKGKGNGGGTGRGTGGNCSKVACCQ